MTGEELTRLLQRHGVEVVHVDAGMTFRGSIRFVLRCRDVAVAALDERTIPSNVELIFERRRHDRTYLGAHGVVGSSRGELESFVARGRNPVPLTSFPPLTCNLGQVEAATPNPIPSLDTVGVVRREFAEEVSSAVSTPPRRIDVATLRSRLAAVVIPETINLDCFTTEELLRLGRSDTTARRLSGDLADRASPVDVTSLLPSNVFLQLGDTTTGLWGCRDDEVLVDGEAATSAQPQGFRADLWRRMCQNFINQDDCPGPHFKLNRVIQQEQDRFTFANGHWFNLTPDSRPGYTDADILTRWRIYQDLKPLYDIVDGATGSAPMSNDVRAAWRRVDPTASLLQHHNGQWHLQRVAGNGFGLLAVCYATPEVTWHDREPEHLGAALLRFTTILDAVAEARVAAATTSTERQRSDDFVGAARLATGAVSSAAITIDPTQSAPLMFGSYQLIDVIGSDYEVLSVSRKHGEGNRYVVNAQLLEERGYHADPARLPRGVRVHYLRDGRNDGDVDGTNDGMVAQLDDWAPSEVTQTRHIDYDGLVSLLRRHLGDAAKILSLRKNNEGQFTVEVGDATRWPQSSAPHFPQNVVLLWNPRTAPTRIVGTSHQVFDPSRRDIVAKTPQPVYFDTDGDIATTPDKAPPWLHSLARSFRPTTVAWKHSVDKVQLLITMPYGTVLGGIRGLFAVEEFLKKELLRADGVEGSIVNALPPPVTAQMVKNIRQRTLVGADGAGEAFSKAVASEVISDVVETVKTIVQNACFGLDDAVAAERASQYHTLILEAKAAKQPVADYVAAWCEQFRTRFALLDLDDGQATTRTTANKLHRQPARPITAKQVRKFRDIWESKQFNGSATEAAAQALITLGKVVSDDASTKQPDDVAVHILVNWCTGLSDEDAAALTSKYHHFRTLEECDSHFALTLQPDEFEVAAHPPRSDDEAAKRAEKQRRDLAALQAELKRERALRAAQRVVESDAELSRFALLEVDEAANPSEAIHEWEASRQRRGEAAVKAKLEKKEQPDFTPPQPRHIEVATPPPCDLYVDATLLPQELQAMTVVGALVEAAKAKRMEN